jgi:hypothetical protein
MEVFVVPGRIPARISSRHPSLSKDTLGKLRSPIGKDGHKALMDPDYYLTAFTSPRCIPAVFVANPPKRSELYPDALSGRVDSPKTKGPTFPG